MAIVNFTSGKILSLKDDGSVNNGGKVHFYTPGTSTNKDTYPTAADAEALTNANANPLILDSAGRGTAFLNGDYKVTVKTSADVTIYTTDSINPTDSVTSTARSSAYTLIGTDNTGVTEASGTFTLTLTAAATLGSGWYHYVKNVGAGTVTIGRANAGNTINGTAANLTLEAGQDAVIRVIAAETGFITDTGPAIATTWSTSQTFTTPQYFTAGIGPGYIQNYSLSDAVAASAYTMTLSAYDGTALSSTNKAQFTFGNATAGTGTPTTIDATANLTLTLSSGSTLGATSGTAFRLWWAVVNDAGTLRLAVINCSTATDQYSIGDDELITSTAEGGAGAADSAGVWYTGTAVSAKAARIIGYTEHSLATAGTWNEEADKMRLWQPGMKLPGDVVQVRIHEVTAFSTAGTTAIPYDNTIPQNTEGDQVLTKSATAKSAADLWRVDVVTHGSNSGNSHYTAALFQDSTASALASASHWGVLDRMGQHQLSYTAVANSTSSTTFNVRIGSVSGTTYLNGEGAAGLYNGTIRSYLRITEIMG